jgi:hypothetical protein
MYTELSGTAVDPALRAALQDGELMKKQKILKKLLLMIQPKLKLLTKAKQKEMSSNYEKIN